MIIVSMFTPRTPYENEIKNLISSLIKFDHFFRIYPIKNLCDWTENCAQNTAVLLQALEDFPDHDILFVDADATIERKIDMGFFNHDFGIHLLQYPDEIYPRYNTGTIFARNNQKSRAIIKSWQDLNSVKKQDSIYGEAWEQANLRTVLAFDRQGGAWDALPDSYCWIFDNAIQQSKKKEEPYIVHHQASRRFKGGINGK